MNEVVEVRMSSWKAMVQRPIHRRMARSKQCQ